MVAAELVLDAIPANIVMLDSLGQIVAVNTGWRSFESGDITLQDHSTLGQNYLDVCDRATGPDAVDARRAADGIRSVLNGNQDLFSSEYPCDTPSGRRWFRMLVSKFVDGERPGAVVMHVDITGSMETQLELSSAKAAAHESEQRLEFALAAAKTGNWSLDLRTNVAHRSLRHDECFGYTELLPSWGYDTFLAHVDPVDRERIDACFQAAMAGEGIYDAEFRTTWADGSRHWLWTKGQFYFDKPGLPVRVAGIVVDVSERKREEELTEQILQRLQEAQHIAKIGDWTFDVATEAISWSPEVFELLGRDERLGPPTTLAEVVGLFDEAGADLHFSAVAAAIATGETQHYTLSMQQPAGQRRHFDVVAVPQCDAKGTVATLRGTVQDVSATVEAGAKLRESEERLELATRAAQMGIWDLNLNDRTLVWDQRMFELFGANPREGGDPRDIYGAATIADDDQRIRADLMRVMKSSDSYHTEFRIKVPNGDERYLETYASVHRKDGVAIRFIGMMWDITERKRAELAALRLAEIVTSSDDAMIGANLEDVITSWNQAATTIFGYTAADIVGSPFSRLVPADYNHDAQQILENVLRGQRVQHFETVRLTHDGRRIDVSVTASPIRDASGTLVGVSRVIRDITEQKKLERVFLRQQRVESIGALAGGIAHDLNNTLTPIMIGIDLLTETLVDEDSQPLLQLIGTNAQHGANMVQQLLLFARGVDGQRLEVKVAKLVADVAQVANDTFLKRIQVRTDIAADVWQMTGDPTQLNQVLMNLCVNARDAMPSGGTLSITADNVFVDAQTAAPHAGVKPGPYVHIAVTDSGTGIPPDLVEKIFDPFFTTKEVGKGTGLGLPTTIAIVQSHGGFLTLDTEPGVGTTFHIFIPASIVSGGNDVEARSLMPHGHGETILVVDDEPSVRHVTQRTLEKFGYAVLTAKDGAEAVSIYTERQTEIALVITDMTMPVMNGPTTIRELRRINPHVRIIAASGLANRDPTVDMTSLAVNHVLAKPYTRETLLTTVRATLSVH